MVLRLCAASVTSRHWRSVSCPVCRFCDGISAARESSRETSCSRDISSEKIATVLPRFSPAYRAMFRAMLVLPMPGRAAIRISSDLFSPRIMRSRSERPVEMPGNFFPESAASDIWSKTV